ncbi:MAG: alpha/beta fold hydrolase [Planctomycetes bacterium]|nr:alpha/beta fold hydrolase [Planctomycetota bacterium]
MRMPGKKTRLAIVGVIVLLVGWLGSSGVMMWKLTCRSREAATEPLPVVAWANFEEHRLSTTDGEQIGAWLIRREQPRGCVLVLHGNGGSRRSRLRTVQYIAGQQFNVLAITLRAHGDSTGELNDFGWSARHDVIAAVDFLEQEFPDQPIFVVGRSLGAAAAIFAAESLGSRVRGYFLEQPYKDLDTALWNRLQIRLPPVLDWTAYQGMRLWAPCFLPVDADEISPFRHAAAIPQDARVVVLAGADDQRVRLDETNLVFSQVVTHGQLVIFPDAKHEQLMSADPELYKRSLREFLSLAPAPPSPELPSQDSPP